MPQEPSVDFGPDKIVSLLEQIRVGTDALRERAARELLHEVHRAIYPMCLKILDNPDDAYETEAETVAQLLGRVGRDDYADAPIVNGTARAEHRPQCLPRFASGQPPPPRPTR